MKISPKIIQTFREEGWSYRKIADLFHVNKGVVWRILKSGKAENIGNKSRLASRPMCPVWEILPDLYHIIDIIARKYSNNELEYQELQDALLDWAYHRTMKQFIKFQKQSKKYFVSSLNRFALHYNEHKNRKKYKDFFGILPKKY